MGDTVRETVVGKEEGCGVGTTDARSVVGEEVGFVVIVDAAVGNDDGATGEVGSDVGIAVGSADGVADGRGVGAAASSLRPFEKHNMRTASLRSMEPREVRPECGWSAFMNARGERA